MKIALILLGMVLMSISAALLAGHNGLFSDGVAHGLAYGAVTMWLTVIVSDIIQWIEQ